MQQIIHAVPAKQSLHFLHVGKTGGSAIKFAIAQHDHSHDCRYNIHFHSHNFLLRDVPKGEKVFFFLRDPISRFISGFNSRYRQGKPKYFYPWSEYEKTAFGAFSTPNQLALALSSIDSVKREQAQLAMLQIAHVRDSYWKWFESENYFKSRLSDIIFIGFQEKLTEDFEILKSITGLPASVVLPSDDIEAHRSPIHQDKNIESQAAVNLKVWNRSDFEFIELCKQFTDQS